MNLTEDELRDLSKKMFGVVLKDLEKRGYRLLNPLEVRQYVIPTPNNKAAILEFCKQWPGTTGPTLHAITKELIPNAPFYSMDRDDFYADFYWLISWGYLIRENGTESVRVNKDLLAMAPLD